jgi:FixJ family two-component response regulator
MAALSPETRVLFISGFTENTMAHRGALEPGAAFLQKPFTAEALAQRVRRLLDAPRP